jgi:hypothetical protein
MHNGVEQARQGECGVDFSPLSSSARTIVNRFAARVERHQKGE